MGKLRKNRSDVKTLSVSRIREIIILFLIMYPVFILAWLITASFNPICKNIGLSFIFFHFIISAYVYIKRIAAKIWLGFELYIWFSFSIIMVFTVSSMLISKAAIAACLFILAYIGIYFLCYRFIRNVWNITFDDNVKSGRYDLQNGTYSVIHAPVQYKYKNKTIGVFTRCLEVNGIIIINISAVAGVMISKGIYAKYALGIGAAIAAILLPMVIIEKYYNLIWAIHWEKEHGREIKIAYI